MAKSIPINRRVLSHLAKATIKNLIDAIVELVTNSDDSYKELEAAGKKIDGRIEIYVNRKKGGICQTLKVKDYAEGMTKEELIRALEFAGETSGVYMGRNVRGLFGRGLKESIIGLGEGEIITIKDGKKYRTKIWSTKDDPALFDDNLLENFVFTNEPNGTEVVINITNEKIRIADYEKFKNQIINHYALREINYNPKRKIFLTFEELSSKSKYHGPITSNDLIKYNPPLGIKVFEDKVKLKTFNEDINLVIYEANKPLESPKNNPFGRAGILIKIKGAIIENQLFKYEDEPAALYFFGEALCPGLGERIINRQEHNLLNLSRKGLDWNENYCQEIGRVIEETLEPFILKKKEQLNSFKPIEDIDEKVKKNLKKLANFLNQVAKEELGDESENKPEMDLFFEHNFSIVPSVANVQINKPRTLTIYAPEDLVEKFGCIVKIISTNENLEPSVNQLRLEKSLFNLKHIFTNHFKVFAYKENEQGEIIAELGNKKVKAIVTVKPPKSINKSQKQKRVFITEFKSDNGVKTGESRARYEEKTGVIYINTAFPSINKFIKNGLKGVESVEGRILLSEIVGEVFFRQMSRKLIEKGGEYIPGSLEGQIDAFTRKVNELQKKYLHKIQELIFSWKF